MSVGREPNGSRADSSAKESRDKYRDLASLGSGGMGEVVLSIAAASIGAGTGFDKVVVRKRLHAALADDKHLLRMFLREARLSVRLNHPNVVQSYEVGFDGDRYFIVMEYLEGQSLHAVLKRASQMGRVFPLEMRLHVLAEACAGLHHAHELTDFDGTPLGITHRDVSPHNIFITYDGQVKVVDFGVAKIANSNTQSGFLKGKLPYMSPEHLSGEVDRRADVFTVGVCLWEAFAGRRMWHDALDGEIIRNLGEGVIPSLRAAKPEISAGAEALVSRAIAARPDDRHPTAQALQADLEKYLDAHYDRVTARDVGGFVATLFADARTKIRAIIERELSKYQETTGGLELASRTRLVNLAPGAELEPLPSGETTSRGSISKWSSSSEPIPQHKKGRAVQGALVVAAFSIAIVALFLFSKQPPAAPRPSSATTQVPATTNPSAPLTVASDGTSANVPAPNGLTQLTFEVTPKWATIEVDGNPIVGRLATAPTDGRVHAIRIGAPDYLSKTELVSFDRPAIIVVVALDRGAQPGAPSTAMPTHEPTTSKPAPTIATATTTSAVATTATATAATATAKVPLDREDPWAK